jgi:hypothetical protein
VTTERAVAEAVDQELASAEDLKRRVVVVIEEVEPRIPMLALLDGLGDLLTMPSGPRWDRRWRRGTECIGRWLLGR